MLKNSTLTQLDHIFHLKSYNTLLMLVVLLCFFSEVNEKNYSPGNWADHHEKGRAVEVLVMEAMSSEESCYEDNGGNTSKITKYSVHRLQWESRRMKTIKKKLDKAYKKNLTSRAKERILPRVVGQPSLRCPPTEIFQSGQ